MGYFFIDIILGFIGLIYLWIKSGFRQSYSEIIEQNEIIDVGKYLLFITLSVIMIILLLGIIAITIIASIASIFS